MDAPGAAAREVVTLLLLYWGDVHERIEPEVAVELAVRFEEPENQGVKDVGLRAGQDLVALAAQRGQEVVLCLEAAVEQALRDGVSFVQMMEVAANAQEVARVYAVGQGAALLLRLEDGEGVDDGVAGIAGDGVPHAALGVEQ